MGAHQRGKLRDGSCVSEHEARTSTSNLRSARRRARVPSMRSLSFAMPSDHRTATTFELVRAFYERIWNVGELRAADELLAADFTFRGSLETEIRGRAAFCDYVHSIRSALDHYHCHMMDCVTEGDRAFAKMLFSGIHVGP